MSHGADLVSTVVLGVVSIYEAPPPGAGGLRRLQTPRSPPVGVLARRAPGRPAFLGVVEGRDVGRVARRRFRGFGVKVGERGEEVVGDGVRIEGPGRGDVEDGRVRAAPRAEVLVVELVVVGLEEELRVVVELVVV